MNNKSLRIIISGGGTGGHIFPAISIANALRQNNPDVEILFVGAEGRMEMEKVPASGYKIVGLPVIGLKRKLSFQIFSFIFQLWRSMRKARKIIKDFKPDIAIGVGGYASGPALKAAAHFNIPYYIQEQNSFPGITNKLLAKNAKKIFVAYDNMEKFFPADKIIKTGNPIRQDIINIDGKRAEAFKYFNLNPAKPAILIIGGSLGARTINESIKKHLTEIIQKDISIIWQTGKNYIDNLRLTIDNLQTDNDIKSKIYISDFIYRMDLAYAAADIIISRAGASTISELCVVGKPAIFVPSPNVAEDHQTKNAYALASINAAIMIKDNTAIDNLVPQAIKLIKDTNRQNILTNNINKLAANNAANTIAEIILTAVI